MPEETTRAFLERRERELTKERDLLIIQFERVNDELGGVQRALKALEPPQVGLPPVELGLGSLGGGLIPASFLSSAGGFSISIQSSNGPSSD